MHKIPSGSFQGYYWRSNETIPTVVNGDFPGLEIVDGENPFIVEGQLFDLNERISYAIRFIDGKYLVFSHKVDSLDDVTLMRCYPSWPFDRKLLFVCNWRPEPDSFCEGMDVLKAAEFCFVGFDN